ncbi:hypothetical protein [Pseudomonas sp. RIT288]|jgi:hypothetical protein|uniref:hypothetical protein n=1 Tax=Pseudomonas sp. RIT288 TaxID=1470589 RepID=UPI0015A6748C|nr:hypothetical protein [Pseudomonas sp. RIT288]
MRLPQPTQKNAHKKRPSSHQTVIKVCAMIPRVGCLIALLNAWLICSRRRGARLETVTGVGVSPLAADPQLVTDGRFIVSGCLNQRITANVSVLWIFDNGI